MLIAQFTIAGAADEDAFSHWMMHNGHMSIAAILDVPTWTPADRLRKAREYSGLSQLELATKSKLSRQTITNAERGFGVTTTRTFEAISEATGVNLLWLRTGQRPGSTDSWLPAPGAVDDVTGRMQSAVGNVIASDEAILRVLSLETVAEMKADERFLAWMMVTAAGDDPARVGLSDEDVPAFFDADQLRDALCLHGGSNPGPKD